MTNSILHWLWRRRYPLAVGVALTVAIALRLALVLAGWPGTDSDDATMGLMARHILSHGEYPIFFWGQAYMGSLEAYIAAFFFALFGASPATLKLSLIVLYALFLLVMYVLLKLLFSQRWVLVGLVFLSLGSPAVLYLLLNAYGGYLETLLFGALLILLTCLLLRVGPRPRRPRQWLLFGAWGLVAGFGVYSDLLIAPFVLFTGLALLATLRRDLLSRAGLLLCMCFLLGVSPWAIYIATAS
ncbi:MAG TPA: glycosyltransferase family 39 protein, partial [Ktedonobacterales bacterium]|nr:glycosyltransferase family 39 protein [Ktedonobacterales bacterium]